MSDVLEHVQRALIEENAACCQFCGGKAFARISAQMPVLFGWYGSTIADNVDFVVVDQSLKAGPVCDPCIEDMIKAERLVSDEPIDERLFAVEDVPEWKVTALLCHGMEQVEFQLTQPLDEQRGVPVPPVFWEGDDPLAEPFIDPLFGRSRTKGVNLAGVGKLIAMISCLRGKPLVTREARIDAARAYYGRIRLYRDETATLDELLSQNAWVRGLPGQERLG